MTGFQCRSCVVGVTPHHVFPYLCTDCCAGLDKWLIDLDQFGREHHRGRPTGEQNETIDAGEARIGRAGIPRRVLDHRTSRQKAGEWDHNPR